MVAPLGVTVQEGRPLLHAFFVLIAVLDPTHRHLRAAAKLAAFVHTRGHKEWGGESRSVCVGYQGRACAFVSTFVFPKNAPHRDGSPKNQEVHQVGGSVEFLGMPPPSFTEEQTLLVCMNPRRRYDTAFCYLGLGIN